MAFYIVRLLICALLALNISEQLVGAQENAQTRIPNSLAECYRNPEIYERDNRLPATINTLIELVRKVEDSGEYSPDIKEIVVSMLHRFRVDGIEHARGNFRSAVLAFSPSGYQFSKHRLLLSRLIPGSANRFPNNTLSPVERCTLHYLISSSIETQIRGDEATRCGQLAQLRSDRVLQAYELSRRRRSSQSNYVCDAEMWDMNGPKKCRRYRIHSRERHYPSPFKTTTPNYRNNDQPTYGYDYGDGDGDGEGDEEADVDDQFSFDGNPVQRSNVDNFGNTKSNCPVENGVIRTAWGAVAAGPLIAGIAAGLVQQNVAILELLKRTRHQARNNNPRQVQLNIDNRWAATLAGDLAEVTLLQGPFDRDSSVGASGGWNSTTVPHWYFLLQKDRLELTDAEIRGGIDGLVLGLNIQAWRSQTSQLRLSQLLDMYYSHRGVFATKFRSCNRRALFTEFIQPNQLQAQTIAFSTVLDREMQLQYTLDNQQIEQYSIQAAEALVSYLGNGLNDVTCDATSAQNSPETRTAADLHIFVETTWQFVEVQPALAALLENLEVNRFGTRYTLYNANDASVIVNTTSNLSDFYLQWNQTSHSQQSSGLNLAAIIKKLREVGANLLDGERARSQGGGRSFVSLVVPQLTGIGESDRNYVVEQLVGIRERNPDLTLLFWAGGSQGRFAPYVVDQQRDLFNLGAFSSGGEGNQQINSYTQPVIKRIQSVPRRIGNPRCSSDWQQSDWGPNAIDQFVDPASVNFYRLSPNYFYRSGGKVRIKSGYQSQIIVCTSRRVEQPRYSNSSQQVENVNCRQLVPTDSYDYELGNACEGSYLIQHCPPLYISVQPAPSTQANFMCTDPGCRFPDDVKVVISIENLGCYSGTSKILSRTFVTVLSVALVFFFQKNLDLF